MNDDGRSETEADLLPPIEDSRFGGLLSVDSDVTQRSFTLLITGFVVLIIVLSLSYSRDARLFPLTVAIPILGLAIGLLLIQTVPSIRAFAESMESSSMIDAEALGDNDWDQGSSASIETVRKNAVRMLAWVLTLVGSIFLFGHIAGLALSLTVVFRYYSDLSWVKAILFALANVAFLTVLFTIAFNARLFPGVFLG